MAATPVAAVGVGLGALFTGTLLGSRIKRGPRSVSAKQPEPVVSACAPGIADVVRATESEPLPLAPSMIGETSAVNLHSLRLESGSIVCFSKHGRLMHAHYSGSDIRLLESNTPIADVVGHQRITQYPVDSAFLVGREGDDITFACLGADAQLLKPEDDTHPLYIRGHKATEAHRWRHEGGELINKQSKKHLPLDVRLLHIFAADEICKFDKCHRQEIAHKNEQIYEQSKQVSELESKLADVVSSHVCTQDALAATKSHNKGLQRQVQDLETLCLERRDIILQMDQAQSLSSPQAQQEYRSGMMATLSNRAQQAEAALQVIKEEHEAEVKALQQEHDVAMKASRQQHGGLAETVAELEQQLKDLRADSGVELRNAQTESQVRGEQVDTLKEMLREATQHVPELQNENKTLRARKSELEDCIAEVEAKNKDLEEQASKLQMISQALRGIPASNRASSTQSLRPSTAQSLRPSTGQSQRASPLAVASEASGSPYAQRHARHGRGTVDHSGAHSGLASMRSGQLSPVLEPQNGESACHSQRTDVQDGPSRLTDVTLNDWHQRAPESTLADTTNSPRRQKSTTWIAAAAPSPPQPPAERDENRDRAVKPDRSARRWSIGRMQSQDTTGVTQMVQDTASEQKPFLTKPAALEIPSIDQSAVRRSSQGQIARTPVAKRVQKMNKQHQAVGGGPVAPEPELVQQGSMRPLGRKRSSMPPNITTAALTAATSAIPEPPKFADGPAQCTSPTGALAGAASRGGDALERSGGSQVHRSVNSQGLAAAAVLQGSPLTSVEGAARGKRAPSLAPSSKRGSAVVPFPPKVFGRVSGSEHSAADIAQAPAHSDTSGGPAVADAGASIVDPWSSIQSTAAAGGCAGASVDFSIDQVRTEQRPGEVAAERSTGSAGAEEADDEQCHVTEEGGMSQTAHTDAQQQSWECEESDDVVNQASARDSYARFLPRSLGGCGEGAADLEPEGSVEPSQLSRLDQRTAEVREPLPLEGSTAAPNTFKQSLQVGPSEWSALERNAKQTLQMARPPATAPQGTRRPGLFDYSIAASEDVCLR